MGEHLRVISVKLAPVGRAQTVVVEAPPDTSLPRMGESVVVQADGPPALGLFLTAARRADGSPVVAYYDRPSGDLEVAVWNSGSQKFDPPVTFDDVGDVGSHPSLAVDTSGVVHVLYVDETNDALVHMSSTDRVRHVVDDGYRVDGLTSDGVPLPVLYVFGVWLALIAGAVVFARTAPRDEP